MRKGLVLQQNDQTAVIPPDWLRKNISFRQMLDEAVKEGWLIGADQVGDWDLRFADMVTVELKNGLVVVKAVNGVNEAEVCKTRPHFLDDLVEGLKLRFGTVELPLDHRSSEMKPWRMVAPIPIGGKGAITGPAGSGKTWLMRDLTRALLALPYPAIIQSSNPKIDLVAVDVGERVPDVGTRADIFAGYQGLVNIEHYHGFQRHTAINNALVARERAHRLTEMDHYVFLLLDSLWGLVRQLGKMSNSGGFAGKGVSTQALEQALPFLYAGRVVGGGALTVVTTSLDEGKGTRSRVVLDEVGWQTMTFILPLREEPPWRKRPWIDLGLIGSREQEQFLRGDRYDLHLEIARRLWDGRRGKYAEALGYLLELAEVPGTIEESAEVWREQWAQEDEKAERKEVLEKHQAVVNAAAHLKDATDAQKVGSLVAAGLAMDVDWEALAAEVATRTPPEPEVDPYPELPPPEEYVALGKRLKEEGGVTERFFRTGTARKIRDAGVTLEQLEKHLRAGGRPSDLYQPATPVELQPAA